MQISVQENQPFNLVTKNNIFCIEGRGFEIEMKHSYK
jgi:hypothetical protein